MPRSLDALPYRPCVGAVIFNRDGLVFIGKRDSGPEHSAPGFAWQLPQGGIDEGEQPEQAVRREVFEETNISSATILSAMPGWLVYDLPKALVGQAWKGRYRGQMQKWFALRFEGNDEEIDVRRPGGGAHQPEFTDWRWERLEAVPDLVIPFKREVYESLVAAFSSLAKP